MTAFSAPVTKLGVIFILFIVFCIMYSCTGRDEDERTGTTSYRSPEHHAFVGDQTCQSCHADEWEDWKDSHHDRAMAKADDESVLGDFDDITFNDGDDRYRFYRDEDRYMVEAPDTNGIPVPWEITYTFGWEPLQQYLVDFGKGKLQALHIAWDTERDEWFSLYGDQYVEPKDWMHWTGGAMNWNTMCADCHSTNLKQNYIPEADSFHTTWSAINVSCESCHGPGKDHVEFMSGESSADASPERIRRDLSLTAGTSQLEQISTCAPCHALREKLTDDYIHGAGFTDHYRPLLPHPDNYHPDGQIREEAFEYGSFLQSKMYIHGVKCTDCHDPHTLSLKANITDNSLCMQCHEPGYSTPEHHFHQVNTTAAQCINCHMPGEYYMQVDFRRDHSFRVPRPDLSASYGTPNACNDCHGDQSAEWAARAIEDWYGEEREYHFSETFARANAEGAGAVAVDLGRIVSDEHQPEMVRATAIWYLGNFPDEDSFEIIRDALDSEHSVIRNSAVAAMENLPEHMKKPLLTGVLDDSSLAVRLNALRGLSEFTTSDFTQPAQGHFERALQEYKDYLDLNQYFPAGQMNRGQFYENQGETDKAIDAYRQALEKDPYFNPARMNLAYIYNARGNNTEAERLFKTITEQEPEFGQAWYSLALLLSEESRLSEAVSHFEEAAQHLPENDRLRYNWAIALQTLDRAAEAESIYEQAITLSPDNAEYRYGLITLLLQQQQYDQALEHAELLDRLHPNNPQIQQLLQIIRGEL